MIYAGVYDTEQAAKDAANGDPDVQVVKVTKASRAGAGGRRSSSPEDAQKKLRDAPDEVESEGTPPPADDKKPGGDSDSVDFG